MEAPRTHLRGDGGGENRCKDRRPDQIAEIHRHRHGVAAGLAESRRKDLDDPETQRDLWNLAGLFAGDQLIVILIHAVSLPPGGDGGALLPHRQPRFALVWIQCSSVRISPPNP
jgi:hypothetical protein